jgi:hypothetical protein
MSPPTKVGKRKGTKREEGKKSLEADRTRPLNTNTHTHTHSERKLLQG